MVTDGRSMSRRGQAEKSIKKQGAKAKKEPKYKNQKDQFCYLTLVVILYIYHCGTPVLVISCHPSRNGAQLANFSVWQLLLQ